MKVNESVNVHESTKNSVIIDRSSINVNQLKPRKIMNYFLLYCLSPMQRYTLHIKRGSFTLSYAWSRCFCINFNAASIKKYYVDSDTA